MDPLGVRHWAGVTLVESLATRASLGGFAVPVLSKARQDAKGMTYSSQVRAALRTLRD